MQVLVSPLLLVLLREAAGVPLRVRVQSPTMKLPSSVAAVVPEAVRDLPVTEANWKAVLSCFPTEEAAATAVKLNNAILLPYGFDASNRAANIAGSYKVLRELLQDEGEVLEVITKNPGVLGCVPAELAKSDANTIRMAAGFVSGVDSVLGPAKSFLTGLGWWDEKTKGVRVDGQLRAVDTRAGAEESSLVELELEEIELDGETFLYDASGLYNGEKNLLLAQRGEEWDADLAKARPVWVPFGTWDPETQLLEEYEEVVE